tara:strand:- start:432 stop:1175 length:744 start_codon:yes stop_codon:yes gene_type:complete
VNSLKLIIKATKLNKPDIEVVLIRTNRKKTSSIKITHGNCYISAPKSLKLIDIENIINTKYEWISKNISKQKLMPPKRVKKFENNEKIYYLGKKVKLHIHKGANNSIKLLNTNLYIVYKYSNIKTNYTEHKPQIKRMLEEWYKKKALLLFTSKTLKISNKLNLNVNQIIVKKYKRTWGKCSYNGNIFYNWQLIQANENIIDYVVAHEVCHLIHMNHSKDFWESLKQLDSNYIQKIEWLKNNSNLLEW